MRFVGLNIANALYHRAHEPVFDLLLRARSRLAVEFFSPLQCLSIYLRRALISLREYLVSLLPRVTQHLVGLLLGDTENLRSGFSRSVCLLRLSSGSGWGVRDVDYAISLADLNDLQVEAVGVVALLACFDKKVAQPLRDNRL